MHEWKIISFKMYGLKHILKYKTHTKYGDKLLVAIMQYNTILKWKKNVCGDILHNSYIELSVFYILMYILNHTF
jgi:hypothetical protein